MELMTCSTGHESISFLNAYGICPLCREQCKVIALEDKQANMIMDLDELIKWGEGMVPNSGLTNQTSIIKKQLEA